MRCSRQIISNLGGRKLDVISARSAPLHGPPTAILRVCSWTRRCWRSALPMWVCSLGRIHHLACRGSAGTPPMRKAHTTWPGGGLDASSERPDLPRGDGSPDQREAGGAVGLRVRGLEGPWRRYSFKGSLEHGCLPGRRRSWPANGVLLGQASGLPTQFRIGLSSRPIRGSCENPE
jgi:hypothetical protein